MKNSIKSICFLYPCDPLDDKSIDFQYKEEANLMLQSGFKIATISIENISGGIIASSLNLPADCKVIYRGWMLTPDSYTELINVLVKLNLSPWSTKIDYTLAHYLPNWYPLITDLTPETVIFSEDDNLIQCLDNLNWGKYFIKDYVKSLKTSIGSLISSSTEILKVVNEMKKYRGHIEGGICVRRVENYLPNTEKRYFIINNQPFSADSNDVIPPIVFECCARINSPFFSVDVAQRSDGINRIIEIGDGQVSDLVGWEISRFAQICLISLD